MGMSLQYTMNKGFIDEIRIEGTRVRINEKLETTLNSRNIQLEFISGIKEFKPKVNLKKDILDKVNQFIKKHKSLKKPKYIGHIYAVDNKWVVVRTIHVSFSNKSSIFPYLYYNIWILDEQKDFKKINVKFELEFQRILSGNFQNNIKTIEAGFPQKSGKLDTLSGKFFRIDFQNKIKLFFEHKKSSFEELNWSINKDKIQLIYSKHAKKRDNISNFTKPDLFLSHKNEIQDTEFNNLHFYLNKNNWLGVLAILSSHFSEKEKHLPNKIRAFKECHSFSKILFLDENQQMYINDRKEILVTESNDFSINLGIEYTKVQTNSNTNSEILEDYLNELNKNFSKCKNLQREIIIILPDNSPEISLMTAPFIRYCRAFPLINSEDIVSRVISKRTLLKAVFLVNTKLTKEETQILLDNNYQIHKITGKSKDELLFNLQTIFMKIKCVDYLISSYFLVPEEIVRININKVSFKQDILKQREELVLQLNDDEKSKLSTLLQEEISNEEFLQISYDLAINFNQNLLNKTLDIYQFVKDFHIIYEEDKIIFCNPRNYGSFHAVFLDLNSKIPSLIGPVVYSCFKGLFIIPCNLKLLNKEGFTKIKYLYENSTNVLAKKELEKRKNRIDSIISTKWVNFINCLFQDEESKESKLSSETGLGFITIFLPSSKVPYECMYLGDYTIGSLFSIGRIPTGNPEVCLEIVNNCFKQYISPKPKPHTLSLIPYLDRTAEEKAHTEFLTHIAKTIFSIFENSKMSRVASIYEPTDLANTIQLFLECSSFFFWGHGNSDSIELRGQKPYLKLSIDVLENCNFIRPEFVVLGSCNTASGTKTEEIQNLAFFFLKKGFMGICASIWKIDITTTIYGILNILFKLGDGYSLSSIIRKNKYLKTEHFPEVFVTYGDPTYRSDFYYDDERIRFKEAIKRMLEEPFKSSEGFEFNILMHS